MIGQEDLLQRIGIQIQDNTFPKFAIITGPNGSGKRLLVNHIVDMMKDTSLMEFGVGIADVREAIKLAYKMNTKAIYFFPNSDTMSSAAKNALLKVTEEPPKNVWIIMTLESEANTLDTILSRGTIYEMEPYKYFDLQQYARNKCNNLTEQELQRIGWVCHNPGEIEELLAIGVNEFYDYVEKVVDNIAEVSGANVFKIADKLALKDDKGYNLKLFWEAFVHICLLRADTETEKPEKDPSLIQRYMKGVEITCGSQKELMIKGINKSGLLDLWLLDIRKAWM